MKLITELYVQDVGGVVTENIDGKKTYYIEGPFIQTEVTNRNNRRYSRAMMESEIANYSKNMIETRRAIGELGHPPTPSLNHERASHLIESLTPDGNNWIGKAKVLSSLPMGAIVQGLIDEGVSFGVSTRGVGALKNRDGVTLVENYKLSTAADVVSDPSGPDAWAKGIMEGASWIYDAVNEGWVREELVQTMVKALDKPKRLVSEATKIAAFEKFINSIGK